MSREPPPPAAARGGLLADGLIALAIAGGVLTVLLATGPDFGMVWDEGHTVRRDRLLADWFSRLAAPAEGHTRWEAFTDRALDRSWPFSREEPDGHPPFYALLGVAGWRLSRDWLGPLASCRFGPMLLCAATAGALYLHLARRVGRLAGLTAASAFALMPRPFAHAHYAHYDMPMTCLWLLAQVAFVRSLESRRWAVPFGVLLGLAAGTKFTGWFAVVPPALWVVSVELFPRAWRDLSGAAESPSPRADLPGLRSLLIGIPLALATLYAIQPPWWFHPIQAIPRFLASNLSRSVTKPIPTLYLGRIYEFSLPWHNTLVLTGVTTPVLLLVLAVVGIVACLARRSSPGMLLWPLSWLVLMVVRALPNAPGHDGVRLFLPSLASLAVLAGIGVGALAARLRARGLAWVAWLLAAAATGESLVGIARTYPYTDSYYNAALGGLPGAERHGFELTYYWDTMGPEFLRWARAEAGRRPLELRFPSPLVNIQYLREWGELPRDVPVVGFENAPAPDYVLQRRRGVYYPYDWWLDRHGRPEFVIRRQGVDLLRVYSFEESFRAYQKTKDVPIPEYLRH
jgi:hypothetical protein